jgi:hypothetical protein
MRLQAFCKHRASVAMSLCSAEMHLPWAKLAVSVHFGGMRRNPHARSRRVITRRSQVQILPPLPSKGPENGAFLLWITGAVPIFESV